VGFIVDRIGGRRVLTVGMAVQSVAMGAVAFTSSYWALMACFVVAGVAYSVYHPSNYTILTAAVDDSRMGRAFSIHAFAGNLGSASAPLVMVALAALWDWRAAFLAIGGFGLVLAVIIFLQGPLLIDAGVERKSGRKRDHGGDAAAAGKPRLREEFKVLLAPPVLLCFFFYVISHIGLGGFRTFGVSGMVALYGTPLAAANGALTGFLVGSAIGILAGGMIADKMGPRMTTAAVGLIVAAGLLVLVGTVSMPLVVMVAVLSAAGFMRGTVQATRDLIVLSITPKGATGKVFAFVYNGTMIGAAIMPLVFGWVMDRGHPGGVFWITAGFMLISLFTFFGVKRLAPPPPGRAKTIPVDAA
jgi:MFS family permease